ncbi:MAG TPA: hypothetical protein QGI71_01960 [Dehalococcoidia bacterium]|nr:hypothetical protein [Dehalococcoidia bacterium]
MFHRALLGTYATVGGGLLIGLLAGIFVIDARPAVLGCVFGAAAGLMGGAFIAALASGEALAGRGYGVRNPLDEPGTAEWDNEEEDR